MLLENLNHKVKLYIGVQINMAWRNAYSLDTLISQLNTTYPGWLFLGTKGDAAHAAVASDHNPNAVGVVTAIDIGPGGGLNIHDLANWIVSNPHPNLKYIISNGRIANWQTGFRWESYRGSDPHDTHIHISVGRGADGKSGQPYDDRVKWNIGKGEDVMTEEDAKQEFITTFHTQPKSRADYAGSIGKYPRDVARARRDEAPWRIQNHQITYYDQTQANLQTALAEIERLKKDGAGVNSDKIDKVIKEAEEANQAAKALKE